MKEGFLMWIPTLFSSLGANLSILFVNVGNSLSEVGIYFVALMIYNALSRIPSQVQSILFPVMSGYKISTDQILEKGLIFSLVLIMPFSAMVIGFPEIFLEIFGKNFVSGSNIVSLLASIIIIDTISVMIITSQLSKGKFKNYNLIVLPASITRITLYYFLVPMYGSIGAVESWIIGSTLGIFITIFIIRQQEIKIDWKKVSLIGIIPIAISFSLKITEIHFIIPLILIFILSNALYLKMKIIKREDILYILNIFSSEEKTEKRYKKIVRVLDKIRL